MEEPPPLPKAEARGESLGKKVAEKGGERTKRYERMIRSINIDLGPSGAETRQLDISSRRSADLSIMFAESIGGCAHSIAADRSLAFDNECVLSKNEIGSFKVLVLSHVNM